MKTYNRFPWSTEWNRDDIAERLAAFDLPPDAAVLDVGCADGAAGHYLTGLGHPYTGIDRDLAFVELAQACRRNAGLTFPVHHWAASGWTVPAPVVLGLSFLHWSADFRGDLFHLCRLCDETLCLELYLDTIPAEPASRGLHAHPWSAVREALWCQGFPRVEQRGTSSHGRALVQAWRSVGGYAVAKPEYTLFDGAWETQINRVPLPHRQPCWWAGRADRTYHLKFEARTAAATRWLLAQQHPAFLRGEVVQDASGESGWVATQREDLRDWVPTRANVARARAALDWLHGQGYIHGDLTREHLRPVGRGLKLLDYGGLTRIGDPLGYTRGGHPISGEGLLATPELDWSSFATLC